MAPHGGLAIAEACTPDERSLAVSTRAGMEELGRLFAAARPEAVVVATPHNVHIANAMGVLVAGRVAGRLAGAPPSIALDVPAATDLSMLVLESLVSAAVPAVGVSFGSNDPATSVAPMDWGVLIPLWFMGGRHDPPVPLVVVTPARDLSAAAHVAAGAAIARARRDPPAEWHSSPAPTTAMLTSRGAHTDTTRALRSTTPSFAILSRRTASSGSLTSRPRWSMRPRPTAGGRC
ncbi:MAG TPA: hypothetical protein VGS16_06545 [Candidatus Dormibacteraeota bacterium]|nr:hypothetical protein [Candidatus Dormibacteraeota bacterium]